MFARAFACLLSLMAVEASAVAWGQTPWGVGAPGPDWSPPTHVLPSGAHWTRCLNERDEFPLAAAIEGCTELISRSSDDPSSRAVYLHLRGRHYELAGENELAQTDYTQALPLFDDGVERDRSMAAPYVARGLLNYDMDDFDAALADFTRAAELSGRSSSARYNRGRILFRNGDFSAALAEFDAASRLAANSYSRTASSAYHRRKCEVRAALGVELEEALSLCNRAVRNMRNAPESLVSRGYYWFMTGRLDEAAADFARAAEQAPYRAEAIYGRGVVAVRQGRIEGEADIARARQMDASAVDYYANAGLRP